MFPVNYRSNTFFIDKHNFVNYTFNLKTKLNLKLCLVAFLYFIKYIIITVLIFVFVIDYKHNCINLLCPYKSQIYVMIARQFFGIIKRKKMSFRVTC